jgi:ribosome-associated protein
VLACARVPDDDDDDAPEAARTVRKRELRDAGDRSARLATALMKLTASKLTKLELDPDLRAAVDRARAVTAHVARRRAERALAGDLRRVGDLADLERRLANIEETDAAEPRLFHAAEQWRARLIADGLAAAATFPGGAAEPLPTLIANAQRERDLGAPRGAARALFRHVFAALSKATPRGA